MLLFCIKCKRDKKNTSIRVNSVKQRKKSIFIIPSLNCLLLCIVFINLSNFVRFFHTNYPAKVDNRPLYASSIQLGSSLEFCLCF